MRDGVKNKAEKLGKILGYKHGESSVSKVDPRLWDIVQNAIAAMPYDAEIRSGSERGKGDKGNHSTGNAIDVTFKKDGKWVKDIGRNAESAKLYEQYAQAARVYQQKTYPELDKALRWGGGFRQGNEFDFMHLDITHKTTGSTKMAYYSWDHGFNGAALKAIPDLRTVGVSPGLSDSRVRRQIEMSYENAGGPLPPAGMASDPAPQPMPGRPAAIDAPSMQPGQIIQKDGKYYQNVQTTGGVGGTPGPDGRPATFAMTQVTQDQQGNELPPIPMPSPQGVPTSAPPMPMGMPGRVTPPPAMFTDPAYTGTQEQIAMRIADQLAGRTPQELPPPPPYREAMLHEQTYIRPPAPQTRDVQPSNAQPGADTPNPMTPRLIDDRAVNMGDAMYPGMPGTAFYNDTTFKGLPAMMDTQASMTPGGDYPWKPGPGMGALQDPRTAAMMAPKNPVVAPTVDQTRNEQMQARQSVDPNQNLATGSAKNELLTGTPASVRGVSMSLPPTPTTDKSFDVLMMLKDRAAAAQGGMSPDERDAAKKAVTATYMGTSKVAPTAQSAPQTTRGTSKVAPPSSPGPLGDPNNPSSFLDIPKGNQTVAPAPYRGTSKVAPPASTIRDSVGKILAPKNLEPAIKVVTNPDWTKWDAKYGSGAPKVTSSAPNDTLMDIHDRRDAGTMAASTSAIKTIAPPKAPPKTITLNPQPAMPPAPQTQSSVLGNLFDSAKSGLSGLGTAAANLVSPEGLEKAKAAAISAITSSVAGRTAFIDPIINHIGNPNPVENMATFDQRQVAAQNRERLSQGLPPLQPARTTTASVKAPAKTVAPAKAQTSTKTSQTRAQANRDLQDSGMIDSFGMTR